MAAADLGYLSIAEAARLLRSRQLAPTELTAAVLANIDARDGRVKAYLTVDAEGAMAQARAAERALAAGGELGPLQGIPVAIKDIVNVAGLPTTAASRVLAGNVAAQDADLVARLRAAGAVILGKTNTHEFAYGVVTAPTRNPWDLARIPGGSSGGSAAALAAGLALGAVGTDTAGSIRLPAALCGVVGLKPTYGRVSRRGVIPLAWSLDHAGPMTRRVADAALLLAVMTSGADPADPATSDRRWPDPLAGLDDSVRGLRVGLPRAYFYDDAGLDPGVAAAVEAALEVLRNLGAELREMSLPDVELSFAVGRAVQRPEASAYHRRRMIESPDEYGDELRGDLELGLLMPAVDYVHAQRLRAGLRARWLDAMGDLDVLIVPTVPVPAIEAREGVTSGAVKGTLLHNTYPFNLCGFPALSVPCGFTPGGLPAAIQIVGKPSEDALVQRVGLAYESATAWHDARPAL